MTSAADSDKPRAPGFGLANARILLQQARACGIDDQVMLSQTGLSRSQIDLGLVDVTMDQELAMIEALHTNGEESLALGFATGLRYQLATLGVLGMAIVSSRDVRAARRRRRELRGGRLESHLRGGVPGRRDLHGRRRRHVGRRIHRRGSSRR